MLGLRTVARSSTARLRCRTPLRILSTQSGSPAAPAADQLFPQHKFTAPIAATYDPAAVEASWYEWWENNEFFERPASPTTPVFSMVLPPPNITGALHIGHALTVAVQDSLARWRRMRGDQVMWIPGLDHAGIATQSVVERNIFKESGLTRHDLGREAFVAKIHEWHEMYGGRINGQMRRLGASLNWPRSTFTLEPRCCRAVTETFVRLFDKGLIYRDRRIVNWCPTLNTAISDIEVDKLELEGPTMWTIPGSGGQTVELGVMHDFAYVLEGGGEGGLQLELVVSTTRYKPNNDFPLLSQLLQKNDCNYSSAISVLQLAPANGRPPPGRRRSSATRP